MKKLISILTVLIVLGTISYLSAGPMSFSVFDTTAIDTLAELNAIVADATLVDSPMTQAEWEAIVGAEFNTEAELKALTSVHQTISTGAGAITPTPLYGTVYASVTCTAAPSALTIAETGPPIANQMFVIRNVSAANSCTFTDVDNQQEIPMGFVEVKPNENIVFQYNNARDSWVFHSKGTNADYFSSINLGVGTIQGAVPVTTSGTEVNIADATEMNKVYRISAAVDVNIPANMCDTATGLWVTVKSTGANVVSIRSLDAADLFVTSNGVATDAQDELDTAGAAGNLCTVYCGAANTWEVMGEIGTCVDGGAGD